MRRLFFLPLLFLLAACGAAAAPAAEIPAAEREANPAGDEAGFTPATSPAAAALVRPQDWIKGSPDAAITIIEYGDFQ